MIARLRFPLFMLAFGLLLTVVALATGRGGLTLWMAGAITGQGAVLLGVALEKARQ